MRADLLSAQACVDWSVAQLDTLERRVEDWRQNAPYRIRYDSEAQPGRKLVRFRSI